MAVSIAVALAAWRAKALTRTGALAAAAVGSLLLAGAGWPGAALLAAFFVPSTLVGRVGLGRLTGAEGREEIRSARQVLANGAPAAAGGLAEFIAPGLGLWIAAASLAAASADTWATSLGRISARDPILLGTGMRVPRGTSGAVSLPGTVAGLAGATVVAGTAATLLHQPALLWAGLGIGFGGMLFDSALGAFAQARFVCPACLVSSERRRHHCGTPTRLARGWRWLDNDGVNAVTTTVAALAGAILWVLQ
ncbi:MAG TPA: DUF92 domain-containing protein [Gemmatimonadales bacterium]|nr:DUF92 domain-containing protein [Gemmatimonadales bacterium]